MSVFEVTLNGTSAAHDSKALTEEQQLPFSPVEHARVVRLPLHQIAADVLTQARPAQRRDADQGRQMELEHIAQHVVIERQEVLQLALAEAAARGCDVTERVGGLRERCSVLMLNRLPYPVSGLLSDKGNRA